MSTTRVHFISLGCPKNRVDTETMLASLAPGRYSLSDDVDAADVVVVNTCAFVEEAKVESIDTILDVARRRVSGQVSKLVVTGCLAQRYPEELAREMPEVDHFVGTNDLTLVTEILDGRTGDRVAVGSPDRAGFDWELPRTNTMARHTAYLKVSEGCSNTCSFCIIPTLRGPQRSRSIASITAEAQRLAEQGVVELNLVAQDLTAYGYDQTPRTNLTALLSALVEVEGVRWIRLLYAYPRSFPKGLIDLMADSPKIVPYLDLPLQHISDSVLRAMKRGTNGDTIRRRVAELRERLPNVALRTTFICGFPGETEANHRELLDFVREARFERLGAFAYSHEEGTPSFDLPGQLSSAVKRRRVDALMYTQREIARAHNEALVGREVDVLVERPSAESDLVMVGRTAQQAPDIDGLTYLGLDEHVRPGAIVRAVITQVTDYDLAAEPV